MTNYTDLSCDFNMILFGSSFANFVACFEILIATVVIYLNCLLLGTIKGVTAIDAFLKQCLLVLCVNNIVIATVNVLENARFQIIGVVLGQPCWLEEPLLTCLSIKAIYPLMGDMACFTSISLVVQRTYESYVMTNSVHKVTDIRVPRAGILVFNGMLAIGFWASFVVSGMATTTSLDATMSMCIRSKVGDTERYAILFAVPALLEVVPLILWPYVRRTNNRIYSQFQLAGHHQTLQLRAILKRNIEATRPLYTIFTMNAITYLVFPLAYVILKTKLNFSEHNDQHRVLNYVTETSLIKMLINLSNGVFVVLLVRGYDVIYGQMLTRMPCTARLLTLRRSSHATSSSLVIKSTRLTMAAQTDTYMKQLNKMWER